MGVSLAFLSCFVNIDGNAVEMLVSLNVWWGVEYLLVEEDRNEKFGCATLKVQ
jgi:hypothetical protein